MRRRRRDNRPLARWARESALFGIAVYVSFEGFGGLRSVDASRRDELTWHLDGWHAPGLGLVEPSPYLTR